MDLSYIIRQLLNGVTLSLILILISLGLSVIYGLMKILNMAHGEFFILGAYVVVWVIGLGGNFWHGLILAPIAMGLFGFVFQMAFLKYLTRNWTSAILVTWGVGMMIRQALHLIMGPRPYNVSNPFPGPIHIFGLDYPMYRVVIIVIGTALVAFVLWAYLKTSFGMQIRVAIHNKDMAAALGVNTKRINAIVFVTGSALAGLAGALLSPLIPVGPLTGLHYLIDCFFVIILGGASHPLGTLAGGFVMGGGSNILQFWVNPVMAEIVLYVLVFAILSVRPQGLVKEL